jgi:soluble lytic murein transglycosylase-like protein
VNKFLFYSLFTGAAALLLAAGARAQTPVAPAAETRVPPPALNTNTIIPPADSLLNTELREIVIEKPANIRFPELFKNWHPQMIDHIDRFALNRRDYVLRMYEKGKKVFPAIEKTFQQYNVPKELKVLIALESAFNGNAVSHAGAVGYWQIMDETAAEYGLAYISKEEREAANPIKKTDKKEKQKKVAPVVAPAPAAPPPAKKAIKKKDERKNLRRSTAVAARYLRDRFKNLDNDLLLVVASYNYGVGNIWNAMKESGKENPSFWDIKDQLPKETQFYVMNFITLNVLFNNYEKLYNKALTCKPQTIKALAWVSSNGKEAVNTEPVTAPVAAHTQPAPVKISSAVTSLQ